MLELLDHLSVWLSETSLSVTLQSTGWLVPAIQSVHILSIAALIGAALALTLHVLGAGGRDLAPGDAAARFLPVIWWALPILLVSGVLLIVAEPARSLKNPMFGLKMALLLGATVLTLGYQLALRRDPTFWSASRARTWLRRSLALLSLLLWTGVILSGRWIAYVQAF
jgi:hypothetical protein